MAESGSRKRKRGGQNRKKGWRKTDIQDVEEYLDDKRLQERTGGIVADKSDEQLFFVEKVAEDPAAIPKKRGRKESKPLRCESNLLPDPNIKPIRVKTSVKTRIKKPPNAIKSDLYKAAVAATQRKKAKEARKIQLRTEWNPRSFTFDLWDNTGDSIKGPDDGGHYLKVTKQKPVKTRKNLRSRPSEVPAVEVAHPGASYNPAFDDHQDLLLKAHQVEMMKEKEEKRIYRALDAKFPSKAMGEKEYLTEMSAGLTGEDSSEDEEDETSEEEDDDKWVNAPVRREDKKTVTQRNKEKQHKLRELKTRQKKEEKLKKNEIFRIKKMKKDVNQLLAERDKKAQKVAAEKNEMSKTRTKKLGSMKFEVPDLEIKLSDELEGSLRRLKPEGQLLEDRFRSFQKRNIIEPRTRRKMVRKFKKKSFERRSAKEVLDPDSRN